MPELKTKKTEASADNFLVAIEDERKRDDCFQIIKMMTEATGDKPAMWGSGIIGFGHHQLEYASGRHLDWFQIGFAPRKNNITLYIMPGFADSTALMSHLGKFKTGKGCLYIKKLEDVDTSVLEKLIKLSVKKLKR